MSDVTVIGLGAMGSAIAGTFVHAGVPTTVWNRSAEKMQPLVAAGAHAADGFDAAVEGSPVIVVCVDDYTVTNSLFELQGAGTALAGRTLIQFSTGTPEESICTALPHWQQSSFSLAMCSEAISISHIVIPD